MNKMFTLIAFVFLFWNCQNEANQKDAYVPESSGKLNHVNVVMPEKDWNSNLGIRYGKRYSKFMKDFL